MAQGWSAIEVLGEPGEHPDPLGWERASFERALEAAGAAQVLVIGKSLASMFAAEVSERGLPAVWLTPLLSAGRPTLPGEAMRFPTTLCSRLWSYPESTTVIQLAARI